MNDEMRTPTIGDLIALAGTVGNAHEAEIKRLQADLAAKETLCDYLRGQAIELLAQFGNPPADTPLIIAGRAAVAQALGSGQTKEDWLRSRGWERRVHGWVKGESGIFVLQAALDQQTRDDCEPLRHLLNGLGTSVAA